MASRLLFCIALVAGCGLTNAGRIDYQMSRHERSEETVNATAMVAIDQTQLTQMLTTATGIITAMVSAFSESPPDYDYAFDSLNTQGWKMVKILVPAEDQGAKFKNAGRAWKAAFSDAAELAEEIVHAGKSGEIPALVDAVLSTVSKALKTAAEAFPDDSKYFTAFDNLIQGVGGSMKDFGQAMGWMDASALIQMEGKMREDPSFSQMLTTGVGVITSLISAFSEDPPDYEHAIDSVNIQGWKMVKLMVPKDQHRSDSMKKGKKAWDRVMGEANDILEDTLDAYKSGYMGKIIEQLLTIIDTALKTASDILTDEKVFLNALADFIKGFGQSVLEFSVAMEWVRQY